MSVKKIIVGNWKMNPTGLSDAKRIFSKISTKVNKFKNVETVICPPIAFSSLFSLSKNIKTGGQDAFYEVSGAYTGSISASIIKSLGAEYVILGHSERRQQGDTNEIINKKIKASLKQGLKVILCIGENTHDTNGDYLKFLHQQLTQGLAGISRKYFSQIIIAHEPVWAIGTLAKESDSPENFQHNRLFIKKVLSDLTGKNVGLSIPILYGGSVNVKNAKEFLEIGEADGLLIGRVSLIPEDFIKILNIANACE